jgi:hypothetical protein
MDKNVEKREYLLTLLSMTAKESHQPLQEKLGLLRTSEEIRLGIHPRIIYWE